MPQPGFNVPSGNIHGIFATGLPVRFVGQGPNPYLAGGGAAVVDGSGGESPVEGERKAKVARMIYGEEGGGGGGGDEGDRRRR